MSNELAGGLRQNLKLMQYLCEAVVQIEAAGAVLCRDDWVYPPSHRCNRSLANYTTGRLQNRRQEQKPVVRLFDP